MNLLQGSQIVSGRPYIHGWPSCWPLTSQGSKLSLVWGAPAGDSRHYFNDPVGVRERLVWADR